MKTREVAADGQLVGPAVDLDGVGDVGAPPVRAIVPVSPSSRRRCRRRRALAWVTAARSEPATPSARVRRGKSMGREPPKRLHASRAGSAGALSAAPAAAMKPLRQGTEVDICNLLVEEGTTEPQVTPGSEAPAAPRSRTAQYPLTRHRAVPCRAVPCRAVRRGQPVWNGLIPASDHQRAVSVGGVGPVQRLPVIRHPAVRRRPIERVRRRSV